MRSPLRLLVWPAPFFSLPGSRSHLADCRTMARDYCLSGQIDPPTTSGFRSGSFHVETDRRLLSVAMGLSAPEHNGTNSGD
ncbi:hypothetical protein PoB_003953500 [Plakobranchus ocellatus]|uniref:Secreted protein n=1 Tax=Plakobranchus ocellatus TaxID=259542 RepID=A0AAV4AXE6_9GAST|nr:hypothetical protein PoB_003953500 [Plakobranchus ocellatus]